MRILSQLHLDLTLFVTLTCSLSPHSETSCMKVLYEIESQNANLTLTLSFSQLHLNDQAYLHANPHARHTLTFPVLEDHAMQLAKQAISVQTKMSFQVKAQQELPISVRARVKDRVRRFKSRCNMSS